MESSSQLPKKAKTAISDLENQVLVSIVSIWEISTDDVFSSYEVPLSQIA